MQFANDPSAGELRLDRAIEVVDGDAVLVGAAGQGAEEGTRLGELRIQTCNACGAKRFPPGPACQSCEAYDRGYEVASGTGTVFSYVVHRYPPVPGKELPIVIALVDLDEGVRMVGEVVGVADDEIEIGMRLRVDWNRVDDDLTLPIWRRA